MGWGYTPLSFRVYNESHGVNFTFTKINDYNNYIVLFSRYVEDLDGVFSNLLFIFFSLNGALMVITVFQSTVVRIVVNKLSYTPVEILRHFV